jgi:hypothetical protein
MITYLDSNGANRRNHIQGSSKDVVIGQRWVILPYGRGSLDGSQFRDVAHHSNVRNVDDMRETPASIDQVIQARMMLGTHGSWFSAAFHAL